MIVQRIEFRVKIGCWEKILELVKRAKIIVGNPATIRIYTSNIGRFGILAEELEFRDLADMDRFWQEWFAKPEVPELMKEWHEVVDAGSVSEVWNLVE